MSNLFDDAISHDSYDAKTIDGQVQYLLKSNSVGKMRAIEKISYVQSTSSTSQVFLSANQMVTFLLPMGQSNEVHKLNRMVLELSYLNTDAVNAATLLPACFALDRFEILAGTQLELVYSQNMIEDRLFFSKNDEEIHANALNENYQYSSSAGFATSSATLAASTAKLFFLELPCFLTRAQPFLPAINQQLTVNVYFKSSPCTAASASQTVSLTQARIYLSGYAFEESVKQKLLQRYMTLPHYLFYNCPEYTTIPGESISNVSKTSTRLGVWAGRLLTNVAISITDNGAAKDAQYSYYPLQFIDEKNSGTSLYSDSLYIDMYKEMAKQTFWTSAAGIVPVYYLCHSTDVYRAVNNCQQLGSYLYNSNIVLELQAVTNIGSKTVTVTGYSACIFKIQNGIIVKSYA